MKQETTKGQVYLIKSDTLCKIGHSTNPNRRLSSLQKELGEQLTIIHTINSFDAPKLEERLHRIYKDKRFKDEWFDLSETDIQHIKTMRFDAKAEKMDVNDFVCGSSTFSYPKSLKYKFKVWCIKNNTNMTTELIKMIKELVKK